LGGSTLGCKASWTFLDPPVPTRPFFYLSLITFFHLNNFSHQISSLFLFLPSIGLCFFIYLYHNHNGLGGGVGQFMIVVSVSVSLAAFALYCNAVLCLAWAVCFICCQGPWLCFFSLLMVW
jgi:hypothetical protein